MSTPKTKNIITGYLWQWAEENGVWAKKLVNTIISNELSLDNDQRKKIYRCFLCSISPYDAICSEAINCPIISRVQDTVFIEELSNI